MSSTYRIYSITNLVNNKIYIGQSKRPNKRWIDHKYEAKHRMDNMPIHLALNKYGNENFEFKEIFCPLSDNDIDWSEIELIKQWDCCIQDGKEKGYNVSRGGGVFRDTEYIGQKNKEINLIKINDGTHLWSGKSYCHHCKEYVPNNQLYLNHLDNCKSNLNKIQKPSKTIKQWMIKHKDDEEWRIICNMSDFCRKNNLSRQKMQDVAHGRLKQYRGWSVKFYDSENVLS